MNKKKMGLVCIKAGKKIMLLTDGDLRRHSNNLYKKKIIKVATKNPTWVSDTDTGLFSINLMNRLGITSVLVTKKKDIKVISLSLASFKIKSISLKKNVP